MHTQSSGYFHRVDFEWSSQSMGSMIICASSFPTFTIDAKKCSDIASVSDCAGRAGDHGDDGDDDDDDDDEEEVFDWSSFATKSKELHKDTCYQAQKFVLHFKSKICGKLLS